MAARRPDCPAVALTHLLGSSTLHASDVRVSGVELDSRRIAPGDLFIAVPGDVHDGRNFIEQAVANGAAAVVAEAPVAGYVDELPVPLIEMTELRGEVGVLASRFFGEPSADMHVIGVTGTNGKTTTSQLIAQLGRKLGRRYGVIGTLGADLAGAVVAATNTTPDAVSLQRQLAEWRDSGVAAVAMEVSSHALVQGRVGGVNFDTAVFTNLSQDHLDYHMTMADYARAKQRLFTSEGLCNAVVNLDDSYAQALLAAIPSGVKVVTYSVRGHADAQLLFEDVRFDEQGVAARLRTPWGDATCRSPLHGEFNLSNLAAALAALLLAGEQLEPLLGAVPGLASVPGRMQQIPSETGVQVLVDYAHTPDALEQVLRALRPHVKGQLVTVFGCGGDRDRGKRAPMGRLACELSDRVIVTSDNPRNEDPRVILGDIEAGCTGVFKVLADRAEAIAEAIESAAPGDCVLIAGKGHEQYQLIDGERRFFSDEQHARLALAGRADS